MIKAYLIITLMTGQTLKPIPQANMYECTMAAQTAALSASVKSTRCLPIEEIGDV